MARDGKKTMAKGGVAVRLLGGLWGCVLLSGVSAYAASSLPNGASSLRERYQDWDVACLAPDDGARGDGHIQCAMQQQALEPRSHRRVMSIRLETDGTQVRGVATVPFGLDLVRGLTLTNASQPVGDVYSFSTCLPTGCLVPLSFDDQQWASLLKEPKAVFTAMTFSGKPMKLFFSTKGLDQALQRVRSLTQ